MSIIDKLKGSKKGQMGVENLTPLAVVMVILVLTVAIGTLILSPMELTAGDTSQVTNDRENMTGALPTTYTVDAASDANFLAIDDLSVVLQSTPTGTNTTLTEETDFNYTKRTGEVTLKNSSTVFSNYNDPGSVTWNDYENVTDTEAAGVFDTGITAMNDFSDFFTVIVVIAIAAVIFMLLSMVRRSGRAASA